MGEGPPTSLTCASTSSAIVSTCRRLLALVITKASVMESRSPTSKTMVFSAFFAEAARAAVVTQYRMASSVAPSLAIEILADDDGDVDDVQRLAAQDEPARSQGLANPLRRLLFGSVVEHDLGLSVGEAVGVSAQHDPGPGRHQPLGDPWRRLDGSGAVEDLDTNALGRHTREELAHELVEVALADPVHLVASRAGVERLDGQRLEAHAADGQLPHDARQVGRQTVDHALVVGHLGQPRR